MDDKTILRKANQLLELSAELLQVAMDTTMNKGFVPTDDCPLRPTGQHKMLALMIGGIDPEAGISCPFCNESWWPMMATDYGEDW